MKKEIFSRWLKILDYEEKKKVIKLFSLSVIAGFLELFNIALIIPIVTILQNKKEYNILGTKIIFDLEEGFFIFFFIFVFITVLKNIFFVFFKWQEFSFSKQIQVNIASKMFKNYLAKDYLFLISRNSSEFHRNVYDDSIRFQVITSSLINLGLDLLLLLFIFIFLLLNNPIITLGIFLILIIFYFIIQIPVKKLTKKWSHLRRTSHAKMIQYLMQGLSFFKEIKFLKSDHIFKSNFDRSLNSAAKYDTYFTTLNFLPRYLIEIFFIITIFIVVYIFKVDFIIKNLVLLSLIFFAFLRLAPITNRILININNLKFNNNTLTNIFEELGHYNTIDVQQEFNENLKTQSANVKFNSLLIRNVSYRYSQNSEYIIRNLNFKILNNDKVLVFGKSGSGKTTLIDIILGLLIPDEGELIINNDKNLNELIRMRNWQKILSYVPQKPAFVDDTIENNIILGEPGQNTDKNKIFDCLSLVGLKDYVSNLDKGINQFIGEQGNFLSGGQKQRLAIARALYKDSQIIILDESVNSLDSFSEKYIIQNLLELNKTIILISHSDNLKKYFKKHLNLDELQKR